MVLPGLLETLGRSEKSSERRKSEWSSAQEYIVEKMGAENLRITQLRLVTALLWTLIACCTIYRRFDLPQLRWVLMLHHLMAAVGVDEAILMSFAASEPFALRLLRPGTPVTPWIPRLLPRKQTVLGAGVYAGWVLLAAVQLITYRVADQDVLLFTGIFLLACIFDRGLFHSTRPSDILKFLVSSLLRPDSTYMLLACLYFWSGFYKVRGFFHGFVFQYQFLNFSGVSWLFRRCYLTQDYRPRPFSRLFGQFGAWLETFAGLGMMLSALPHLGVVFVVLALAMHVFIFFFGMGPFRWNVMTCYMLLCSTKLRMESAGMPGGEAWTLPSVCCALYVGFFGWVIPGIGCLDPEALGRYFGGYRMATFHFAGNEMYHALLVCKDYLTSLEPSGPAGSVRKLLLERRQDYLRLSEDLDLFTALLYSDGLDVEGALRRGFRRPSGLEDFEDFDRKYMFVPITWLNCRGPLLNTKWDESLPITESFVDLVGEALGFESRMPRGAILVFVAHPMVWMGGQRKLLELFDLTDSKWCEHRWREEVDLPWTQVTEELEDKKKPLL
ncbi:unnamed protein product [Durusdinium trenchii]|uniref:Uncharacterized protein n=2 Tax=Durusdinium trenchii TaxID=1381693 RepID=A0ABP0PXH5_9DINO